MADWTPEQLADQKRICECEHLKNTHERGIGRCCFGPLQRAYGYDDPDCPCQRFVEKIWYSAHQHTCPQCFVVWTCAKIPCDPRHKRFCPYGELCHVASDGAWKVTPETIRKGRGVGALFETRGILVVSPYKEGDQGALI